MYFHVHTLYTCNLKCSGINIYFLLCNSEYTDRDALDKRRLEEAHMRFCILDVLKRYPQLSPTLLKLYSSLQQSLDDITPLYYNAFSSRYAG